MAPLPPHLRRPLTRRFQQALRSIGAAAAPRVQRAWLSLPAYDEDQVEEFATKAAPALSAAKFAAVRQAAGYYAIASGVRAVGVPAAVVPSVLDPREPFISTWLALTSGRPFEEAVNAGALRVDAVVGDYVTSSARQTGDIVIEKAGLRIAGWERVPDGDACAWCLEVSPGFYTSAESADFGHNYCGCSAEPIYA